MTVGSPGYLSANMLWEHLVELTRLTAIAVRCHQQRATMNHGQYNR